MYFVVRRGGRKVSPPVKFRNIHCYVNNFGQEWFMTPLDKWRVIVFFRANIEVTTPCMVDEGLAYRVNVNFNFEEYEQL